jgi:ADP-heptose:LPS heptosyltransferase
LKESAFEFYSIQKDPQEHCALRHIISRSADVLDTAALISHLDLVITVDTMVAHLAGALNLPVWIMLPEQADWRWMLNRTDSPWYPSARLFRQKRRGYWEPLIAELSSLLAHTF